MVNDFAGHAQENGAGLAAISAHAAFFLDEPFEGVDAISALSSAMCSEVRKRHHPSLLAHHGRWLSARARASP